ncbi:MAG TPA: class I SAM-dependent methyltransferase [Chitinophagaceae bacterium]|jgi:ubiquinone/menaquinone biosynthesis C-methylase UbiE|nr:class I SAM-dependent methyltransferase [Chitinophagaceae bacterium]
MDIQIDHNNEQKAAFAFSQQSILFDELYAANTIVQYKRKRVRDHLLQYLKPASTILELNAGTGDDAIFFAEQGYFVHATDIAAGMQEKLKEKVAQHHLLAFVSNELCSYTALNKLENKGPYDCIFSNFAGLNCTGELDIVLNSFRSLLKPGGIIVLVILPKFCLWETALVLKGKFKTAVRRFFNSKKGNAKIDGNIFTCWYYSPSFVVNQLKNDFTLMNIEGLCTIVPPSYIENYAEKHPKSFSWLCKMESKLKNKWPWKFIGDYYIISMKKK